MAELTIKIGRKLKIKAILKEAADVAEVTTLKLEVVMTGRNNSQIKPILNLMITNKPNSKIGATINPEVACVVEVAAKSLEEIVKVVVEAAAETRAFLLTDVVHQKLPSKVKWVKSVG